MVRAAPISFLIEQALKDALEAAAKGGMRSVSSMAEKILTMLSTGQGLSAERRVRIGEACAQPLDTIQKQARKTPETVLAYDRLEGQFIGCSKNAALVRVCDKRCKGSRSA